MTASPTVTATNPAVSESAPGADAERTAEQYDAVAEDYDRLVRPRYDAIAGLVVDRVREVTDVRRAWILELSAGTGALTQQLAPFARSYVATDVSEPMLAVARRRGPGRERVVWRVADVRDLPPDLVGVDLVASSLGPVQESDQALGQAARTLRTGGALVGVTWGDDYRELDLLQDARRRVGLPPRPTTSADELAGRIRDAGLRHVVLREVRMPVTHACVATYLDYRQAFGPVRDLTTPDPDELLRALAAAAAAYTDADGQVVLDWQLRVFSAVR